MIGVPEGQPQDYMPGSGGSHRCHCAVRSGFRGGFASPCESPASRPRSPCSRGKVSMSARMVAGAQAAIAGISFRPHRYPRRCSAPKAATMRQAR
jgi:hypothetical protein